MALMDTRSPIFVDARNVMRRMDRLTVPELAEEISAGYAQARAILETMVEKGWVRKTQRTVRTSPAQGRPADLYEYIPPPRPGGRFSRERRRTPEEVAAAEFKDFMVKRGAPIAGTKKRRGVRDEVRALLALVDAAEGWYYESTQNNHYLVYHPDGYPVTTVPSTPSDWRSLPNALADMKRAGMPVAVAA